MGTYSEWLKNRDKEEDKQSSSYTNNNYARYRAEKSFGLDTFESDLQNMSVTINDIYSGWQTQETMNNTRSSVEEMQNRINAYQSYQSKYGGTDLSDIASGYQSVLDNWDTLTSTYGYYQNADAFNTAQQKFEFDNQFGNLSYRDVQAKIAEYEEGSDEYNYLTGYLGYTDLRDFDKALEDLEYTIINAEGSEKEELLSYQTQLQEARNRYALENKFDLYRGYTEKEDFEELSQYNSTKSDKWHANLTTQYGMGYDDLTYEYINNIGGARDEIKDSELSHYNSTSDALNTKFEDEYSTRDEIKDKAFIYGSDSKNFVTSMEKKGYDMLTEEEISVYNYIYATEGKEKAQEFLDDMELTLTRRVYNVATQGLEYATDNSAMASIALSAMSVPMNIAGSVFSTADTISDAIQGKEYNPYGYYKTPSNLASDIRQYVGENIAENTEEMELFGQNVPSFLYQTTMSTADSAVGALTLKNAFAPIMGMSAYQQKAKELKEAGASEEEVFRGAIASGAFEMIFEKLSLDNLFKIKNADDWGKIITQTLKQAGVEGSEEMFTEIANISFDYLNRQDSSEIMQKYNDYLERGFSEAEAKQKVAEKVIGQVGWAGVGGALSGGVMGGVYSSAQYGDFKSTGEQISSNNRVDDMWELSANSPQYSDLYKLYEGYAEKGITPDNISNAQVGNLYSTAITEADNTLRSKKSTDAQKMSAGITLEGISKVNTVKESKVASTGKTATIEGIKKVDGKTMLVTSEGDVATKDMKLSYHDAELLSYVENMSEEKANLFISQYDGKSDLGAYADSFEMAYAYGEDGFDADTVLNNKGVLTEVQASEIYKTAISNKVTAQQKAVDDINAKYGKTVTVAGKFNDSIIDYNSATTDDSKVNWNSLTSRQRDAITFAKGFSEATGVNITFIKSDVVNGKRVGKNGSYNHATNTIEIDVYAGVIDADTANESIIPTLSHEMTHWMKAKAPAMYNKMKSHIMETLVMGSTENAEDLVNKEMDKIQSRHPDMKVTREYAMDELVAKACEDMLTNSDKARKILSKLSKKEKSSFVAKVKETFKNLMEWVNELLGKYKSNSHEAKVLRQYKDRLKQLSKMWDKALEEAIQTNQSLQSEENAINAVTEEVGVAVDMETESAYPSEQFSERTWTESEYVQNRDKAIEQLSKALDVSKEEAGKYIDDINSVARLIADDRARLDYEPNLDAHATVVKPNSEYTWSVDMSTLCAKRLLFTGTFDEIQRQLPNTALDSDDIVKIRAMMKEAKHEVACGICYVESTRREIGTITNDFIERYKLAQKTGKPITRLNSSGKEVELTESGTKAKFYAEKGYTPTLADLNTTDIDLVKRDHPSVYGAYLSFMNARGQAKPKLLETRAEYKGEILTHFKAKSAVNARNNAGGLRLQSFSDFETPHLIDMMQIITDMSRVGLKSQAYTKVANFAEAFGDTGVKINLSLIAKDSGLDAEGNLIFDDIEGINHEDAFRLRDKYSKNVGTILVGKNDAHIIKAMADPRIDYIIPFHKSSWKESLYDALGLTGYDDYTATQNEKPIDKNRKIKNFDPSEYWDFSKSGEENAQIYLEKCKADGRVPKFPQFQGYEGYWKLLIDFKMYDNDGVGSPQTTVKPNFNMEECNRILNEYKGGHRNFPVAKDVVDKFVKEYKSSNKQEQYSDREVRTLTNEDYEQLKSHFGTTTNYNVAGYMLKDGQMLDFSGKHWGDTTSRSRQVDHRDVQEVIEDDSNGFDSMVNMISNGNIRLMPETGGINLAVAPTVEQSKVLEKYINNFRGEVVVDIDKIGGDTIKSFTYDRGTSAKKILDDIGNYFRGGRQSELMMFHTQYSDREIIGESGKSYGMGVYLDSSLLTGLSEDERKQMVKLFVTTELAGNRFTAYDSSNNAIDVVIAGKNASIVNKNKRKVQVIGELYKKNNNLHVKQEAIILADEMIANAKYDSSKAPDYSHGWLDNYGQNDWEYWKVHIQEKNGTVWEATLNIANSVNGEKILYDIDPIKKVEGAVKSASNSTNDSINQNTEGGQVQNSDREPAIDWLMDSIDEYLAKLSVEDLLDDFEEVNDINTDAETQKTERAKRRVDEVNKRLKAIGLSFNGTKSLAWTDERIDKYLGGGYYGSSNPNYAQAYIAYVTPQQFLNLTVGSKNHTLDMIEKESAEYGDVDIEKLGNSVPLFLDIDEGRVWTKVTGHEGRHRMYLLGKAGFEKVPVLLFDYRTKYSKTAKDEMKLIAQRYNNTELISKSRNVVLNDVIPFSQGNRDLIVEKFGSGKEADIHYSDRDNVSVYDLMGQNKELQKQNAKLEEDVNRLKERLKLEKQVTKGNTFNANQLRSVAKFLRNSAGSTYNEDALVGELKDVYSYIVESPQVDWTDLMAKCYEVARNVLDESKGYKVTNDYFKSVLEDVRRARITLSEEQIQEAKSAYGARYRDAFMGRVMLVNNGISLDQQWQEWATMYPDIFDESVTGGDQITALSDIYDALREGAETYQQYNDAESIRAFAVEIYNQYWNVSTIRTTADKYDKQIKKLNFEHRKSMNELRSDYKKRVEDQKLADSIHYGRMLNDIRRRREEEVKQAKESGKQRLADYKDRVAKNAKIDKITKNALTLNEWLTKNSKDAHVPEVMKAPVAYLLSAIDFSSKQLLGMRGGIRANTPTKKDISLSKALEQVHDMVQKINSAQIGEDEITEIYGTFADFPAGFADDIRELSSKVNDVMRTVGDNAYVLNEMSLEQLEEFDKIITIIKATVTKMNKFLAIRHAEGVANMSQQSILYMDSLGKAKERGKIGSKIEKMLDWGNALPYYTFKRFGEGGQKVYEALQNGWDKFAFHINDIINYAESTYTDKEVKEWEATVKEFDVLEPVVDETETEPRYQKIKMTVPQIMSLYCLQKREQAKGHLMGGGMRVADFKVGKLNVKTISQTEGVVLTESEIDTIINSLTDRQKAVADALQNFMNTTCAEWGNEVSMLRFGYKAFGEENYFPIQSDKNNLAVNDETEQNNSLFRLLNMSFTKGTINKANNRIVISDIFDVFSQHTSDMAKYNSLALPVIDAFKWYNYKEKIKMGETQFNTKSLKQSMENAFGKESQNYVVTFLRDINGEQSAGRDVVGKGFFTNAKLASVGFNMRVVALQPTSYVRASAIIDPKYLTKAFIHKPKMHMAQKHCGIALWKSLGFYDINVQNNVTDLIKHNQTARDKVVEASMKGAEIADKITWGYLWNACELEVRDKQKNLKVGSDEFYSAVANRLREVIYTTQVVDSTMTRSHMMRSKDGWDKMATAFMSEPTLSYNMLQDCYMDWKLTERQTGSKQKAFKKCGKKMARTITAYTVTSMICALVESGFDIFRDDEDEITPEEFIELYLKNLASNMNILNNIPYVKEIVSMMQGFSSSRTDTQWMQYLTYTITGIGKLLEGEGNAYTTAKNALRAFSYGTGLPLYNLWRDGTAVLDKTELLTTEELEEMFNDTIGDIFPSLKED
jgi:hypothetical protein